MPTQAQKRHRVGTGGPWGTGLLILGVAVLVQGLGYVTAEPDSLQPALASLSQTVPPAVWGGLWLAVGGFSVWKALTPPQQHWEALPVVGLFAGWSAAFLTYWLVLGLDGEWTRTWMSAVGWAMLAAFVGSMSRCVNPPRAPK